MGKLRLLHNFDMGHTGIVELPEDFGGLSSLRFLNLSSNRLHGLPVSFSCLSCFHTLDLSFCGQLQSLSDLPLSLIKLNAYRCLSMERLPQLSCLKFLQELNLNSCKRLSEIQGIGSLSLLQKLDLSYCKTLQSLPELPSSLVTLDISDCISMEILPNLSNLKNLEHICLDNCKKLVEIQGMKGLILLQKLHLVKCGELQSLPELPLGSLRELVIMNCRNLSKIQGVSCVPRLQILILENCENLQSLPKLPSSLIRLEAYNCCLMERLPDMTNLKKLEVLVIEHCYKLSEIQGISCLPLLQGLEFVSCIKLHSLPKLPLSLIRLQAHGCISLERLPDIANWKNLEALDLWSCNNLAEIQGLAGLESLIYLCLDMCYTCVQNLPKIVAQGMLPTASDKWEVQKRYLIADDDNIKGMVFFLVYELPTEFSYDSGSYYSSDGIPIEIWAEIQRNDGKRITCGIDIRLEGWENTDIGDQLYSCYFQGLTWFGIPLQKGDILELSAVPSDCPFGCDLDVKMLEFVVADEAMEDGQQLEKGVKHFITSILECEPKNHERSHSPYRMLSVSGGRREC